MTGGERKDSAEGKPILLVVDDEEDLRTQMRWAFADDYEVLVAGDRATAVELARSAQPPVVTLDLGLPPKPREVTEGLDALVEILVQAPLCKVIVITGRGEKPQALEAIGRGAYDFLCKPVQLEELRIIIQRALHLHGLESERQELERRSLAEPLDEMLGANPRMLEIFAAIRRVAPSDIPVLVLGDTGTGKELVARAIHRMSDRAAGPFVVINCGAIPENLLESELFGHEKGSFTSAHAQRRGRIELAQNGTLFLDEVGELSPPLQVKLLHYLQGQRFQRVGGREDILVNARVVAATNRDPRKALEEGGLREDLYYRLSGLSITLPPLRERGEDVVLIASALLQRHAAQRKRRLEGFTRPAIDALLSYSWPGNVRELENRVRRGVIMAEGRRVTPQDLELASPFERHRGLTLREVRDAVERDVVQAALGKHRGNVSRAAIDLGVSRPTLHELIQKHSIARKPTES